MSRHWAHTRSQRVTIHMRWASFGITPRRTASSHAAVAPKFVAASISVRAILVLITYAKAIAWFRGQAEVGVDDVGAVLPFVLVKR